MTPEYNDYNFPSRRELVKCEKCGTSRNVVIAGDECAVCALNARPLTGGVASERSKKARIRMKKYWKDRKKVEV